VYSIAEAARDLLEELRSVELSKVAPLEGIKRHCTQ